MQEDDKVETFESAHVQLTENLVPQVTVAAHKLKLSTEYKRFCSV